MNRHEWFAWHPVVIWYERSTPRYVWLQWVERVIDDEINVPIYRSRV